MAGWILPTLTTTYLQISALYLAVFFAYYPTTQVLFERWLKLDESLSHGLLVVGMSIYLAVKYLHLGAAAKNETSRFTNNTRVPLACLLVTSLAWLLVSAGNINILEQMLMPLIVWFALASTYGMRQGIAIALPVAFLYFAIPLWDYFNPLLVDLSSITVTWAVEKVGIAALINSNTIILPYGSLIIADGCSGLRYFTIALALSCFVVLDSKKNLKLAAILLACAVALSLFSNWLRIFLLILIAYETDMESSLIADHETFGWVIFCIVLAPLFFIARRFELFDKVSNHAAPTLKIANSKWAFMLASLLAAPLASLALAGQLQAPNINAQEIANHSAVDEKPNIPVLPNAKLILQKLADNNFTKIRLYRVVNWRETSNDNLVPYWPTTYSKTTWNEQELPDMVVARQRFRFVELTQKLGNASLCMAYGFRVGKYTSTSYKKAKLLQIPVTLSGSNIYEGKLAIAKSTQAGCEPLREPLKSALNELATPITSALKEQN